jgi:archaemetzincin
MLNILPAGFREGKGARGGNGGASPAEAARSVFPARASLPPGHRESSDDPFQAPGPLYPDRSGPISQAEHDRMDEHEDFLPDIEERLLSLSEPLPAPEEGDWLAEHEEQGQTFREYLSANPVRRDRDHNAIHLCLVGDFDEPQGRVIDLTREYLGLFFDVPVHVRRRLAVADIPARARRKHPEWSDKQVLSTFILREVLEPDAPADALAYLALTACDLWPGKGWNFVFGQANLRNRVGVWSIYRNGWPGSSAEAFRLCLRRTLLIAAHETGHVLTLRHCTAFRCLMNGSNSHEERDRSPLHPCPVCLRKLLWNLRTEPVAHLKWLGSFCRAHGLGDAEWFKRAAGALAG